MNFLDMFSGIGGFALAAYWAGIRAEHHFYSEVDSYANLVYQRRFSESIPLGDIRAIRAADLPMGEWIVCGGFPCQPHSLAGKRDGADDERDLWPECARVLRELRPAVAIFENVPGLFSSDGGRFFNRVLSDISEVGYDCEWQIISALDVGAPHLRKRVWIVAYPSGERGFGLSIRPGQSQQTETDAFRDGEISNPDSTGIWKQSEPEPRRESATEPIDNSEMADATSIGWREGRTESEGQSGKFFATGSGVPLANTDSDNRIGRSRIDQMGWRRLARENEIDDDPRGTQWKFEPRVRRVLNGVPSRVDRLKGLGNAIVPQVAEVIFKLPFFDRWRE